MSNKKFKIIRKDIRRLRLDPTKGAGLVMYQIAKKRFRELNSIERQHVSTLENTT